MFGVAALVLFSAWCFSTALELHLEARRTRARAASGAPGTLSAMERDEPTKRGESPHSTSAVSPEAQIETDALEDDEQATADLQADTDDDAHGPPMVHIFQRELGGGETLVAAVFWDGERVRWLPEDLSPQLRLELQQIVLDRSGLWPGHGRVYIVGVLGALADTVDGLKWRAERPFRRPA